MVGLGVVLTPDVIVEDNVVCFPALTTAGVPGSVAQRVGHPAHPDAH